MVNARCLRGNLQVKDGYNILLTQNTADNSLTIGAAVGAGAGQLCSGDIPLYAGETPPTGSTVLSGGPTCAQVIQTINGITGPSISILPGQGVSVDQSSKNKNTLVVNLDLHGLAVCTPVISSSESV